MSKLLINNGSGFFKNEKSILEITKYFLERAKTEKTKIKLNMIVDFRFFDSFKDILPKLKELFEAKLLTQFNVLIACNELINTKDFLFKLKADAIILNANDFKILYTLYKNNILQFRANYTQMINSQLYTIEYANKIYSFTGTAGFSQLPQPTTIDLLTPKMSKNNEKNVYMHFFKKLWKISSSRINSIRIITHLKQISNNEVIHLPIRDFIAVTLKNIGKEYLVRNISPDLTSFAEFKNMGYYSCIEKMNKYGSVIFANSIGLSEYYISSMIIKFYFEKNQKTAIITSQMGMENWATNFNKVGLKKSFINFILHANLQEQQFNIDEYENLQLIVIDKAEYYSIAKEQNIRKAQLERLLNNNPNAHLLLISKNIINDSLEDLITLYQMFSRGKYQSMLIDNGVDEAIHMLTHDINNNAISNQTIDTAKFLLNTFMVKVEWVNLETSQDPLQKDLNKPQITTVKYAYDHEVSMKIYEKLIPMITGFNFEYTNFKFRTYSSNKSLTNWARWRLYRTIESSLIALLYSLKRLREKTEATIEYLLNPAATHENQDLFNSEQIYNMRFSYSKLDKSTQDLVLERLKDDISTINSFFASAQNIKYLENRDEKITSLLKIINSESKPTVIFSECNETIRYIQRRLQEYGNIKADTIFAELSDIDGDEIFNQESSNIIEACRKFETEEVNILIANDTIPEDIKLPRAKVIINFDMPINPSILSKRNRIAALKPDINKIKIYNFQSDRRVDKEITLFETLQTPLKELLAYYGVDFVLWCFDEGHIEKISNEKTPDYYLLTKEYKDFLAKKNTDELKSKFAPSLSNDDVSLREFVKYLSISEETLKLAPTTFKKPIYTSLTADHDSFYVIYQTTTGIHTNGRLKFNVNKAEQSFTSEELRAIHSILENSISIANEGELLYIIGIISYKQQGN